jgi:hypothetical protein
MLVCFCDMCPHARGHNADKFILHMTHERPLLVDIIFSRPVSMRNNSSFQIMCCFPEKAIQRLFGESYGNLVCCVLGFYFVTG